MALIDEINNGSSGSAGGQNGNGNGLGNYLAGLGTTASDGVSSLGSGISGLFDKGSVFGEGGAGGKGFDALGGVQGIATGIGGILDFFNKKEELKIAKDSLGFQKEAFNKNFGAKRTTINNRLNDQNAFKKASGRTDLARLVA